MLTLCFTVRLDSRSSGKTGGNVNLRGQGVGSPPCLSGGGQRMGNQEEKEKEVTGGGIGKIRTKIRKITTHFLIFHSGRKTKGKKPGKKGGKAEGLDPLSPRFYIYFEPYTFEKRQRVGVSSRFGLNSVIDVIVFRCLFWCGIWSGY